MVSQNHQRFVTDFIPLQTLCSGGTRAVVSSKRRRQRGALHRRTQFLRPAVVFTCARSGSRGEMRRSKRVMHREKKARLLKIPVLETRPVTELAKVSAWE